MMHDPDVSFAEWQQRHGYLGKFRAFVRDVNDPEKRCRVRAYCPAVMGPLDDTRHWLDWADSCLSMGGLTDFGDAAVPPVGAGVWIEFEMGDVRYPIWVGCWYAGKDPESSEVPLTAKGDGDESAGAPKGSDRATEKVIDEDTGLPVDGLEHQEPLSPYATQYPSNRVLKTASGHVIELDDTPGQERVHVYHRSGSYVEINADGGVISKAIANKHEIVKDKHIIHDATNRILLVDGPLGETIGGLVSQVYMDGVRRLVQKECKEWFKNVVEQQFDADLLQTIGGSHKRTVANNHALTVVGTGSDFYYGSYDFITLEKASYTLGNTGVATNAWNVTALVGDILHQALEGKIKLETLVDNIELTATLGDINVDALAANILMTALQNIEFMATAVAKLKGTAGAEVDGGTVGVKIGSTAVEPLVKGTALHTASSTLATAFGAAQLVGNLGLPVPCAPAMVPFTNFAAAVSAALSPLNKVA